MLSTRRRRRGRYPRPEEARRDRPIGQPDARGGAQLGDEEPERREETPNLRDLFRFSTTAEPAHDRGSASGPRQMPSDLRASPFTIQYAEATNAHPPGSPGGILVRGSLVGSNRQRTYRSGRDLRFAPVGSAGFGPLFGMDEPRRAPPLRGRASPAPSRFR